MESTLADRQHLVAGRFTTADIAVGYALMLAEILGLGGDFGPNVKAWPKAAEAARRLPARLRRGEKALKEMKGPAGVSV